MGGVGANPAPDGSAGAASEEARARREQGRADADRRASSGWRMLTKLTNYWPQLILGRVKKSAAPINIYEAKTHLSELVDRAAAGEEITIAKAGKPLARLVPLRRRKKARKPGALKGKIWIAPDFDDPLPADFLSRETTEGS